MKTYKSDMMRVLHETATDFYESGLMDEAMMRSFDERWLTPAPPMTGEEIAALRKREGISQSAFARTLGVSLNTVGQWERGERRATGAALKLLSLAKAHGLDHVRQAWCHKSVFSFLSLRREADRGSDFGRPQAAGAGGWRVRKRSLVPSR